MGRKSAELDLERIEQLASLGLIVDEIAAVEKVHKRTLERHALEVIERGRMNMRASVKRKQYEVAMTGDKTMLIWLGKQHCDQSDRSDQTIDHTHRYYVEGPPAAESGESWQEQYSPEQKSPPMQ